MYKICLYEELRLDVYEKLIDYALSKSDAFMLVAYRHSYKIKGKEKSERQIIFENNTEPFLEKLKPYLIKTRNYPTEWPSTKVVFLNKNSGVDIYVYRADPEVKKHLLESKGLFKWKYPYFPDDLCFFYKGYCWFHTLAHENRACIYVNDLEDIEWLTDMELKFKVYECKNDEEDLFYESYEI